MYPGQPTARRRLATRLGLPALPAHIFIGAAQVAGTAATQPPPVITLRDPTEIPSYKAAQVLVEKPADPA